MRQLDRISAPSKGAKRVVLLLGGSLSLILALVGAILPVMPSTIFLIMALYCFARSSLRLHSWLLENRLFGKYVSKVASHRHVSPRLKAMLIASTGVSALFSAIFIAPNTLARVTTLCLAGAMSTYIVLQGRGQKVPVRERVERKD